MIFQFSEKKVLLVLQWDEMNFDSDRCYDNVETVIAEKRNGEIICRDDVISNCSELHTLREAYDCYGEPIIQQTKMTSDAAVLGPISDHDEKFWLGWYTEALTAACFRNYRCYICDSTKLSNGKNEIDLYLNNSRSYLYSNVLLRNFRCHIIPVVYEKLSHAIPEFMDKKKTISSQELFVNEPLLVCRIKREGGMLSILSMMTKVDLDSELRVREEES